MTLRFQTAADRLPPGDPTRLALDDVLRRSDSVMREGRDRLTNLRGASSGSVSLTDALANVGQQLQEIHKGRFRLFIDGRPRSLHELVQEEIVLIVREALINAFTHSGATNIVAKVTWNLSGLHVRISDNGCGIDQSVLKAGSRTGHWGLPGMRERARVVHASMDIRAGASGGTEIELRIPAGVAYRRQIKGLSWFRKRGR